MFRFQDLKGILMGTFLLVILDIMAAALTFMLYAPFLNSLTQSVPAFRVPEREWGVMAVVALVIVILPLILTGRQVKRAKVKKAKPARLLKFGGIFLVWNMFLAGVFIFASSRPFTEIIRNNGMPIVNRVLEKSGIISDEAAVKNAFKHVVRADFAAIFGDLDTVAASQRYLTQKGAAVMGLTVLRAELAEAGLLMVGAAFNVQLGDAANAADLKADLEERKMELENLMAPYGGTSSVNNSRIGELPSDLTFHGHEFLRKVIEFRRRRTGAGKDAGKLGEMRSEEVRQNADLILEHAIYRQTGPKHFDISFPKAANIGIPDMQAVYEDHWMIDWPLHY